MWTAGRTRRTPTRSAGEATNQEEIELADDMISFTISNHEVDSRENEGDTN